MCSNKSFEPPAGTFGWSTGSERALPRPGRFSYARSVSVGDPISVEEACAILGTSASQLLRYVTGGRLEAGPRYQHGRFSRAAVEQLACQVLRLQKGLPSYWATGQGAANVLGVSRSRLDQLARRGDLPYLTHRSGVRLYRRDQLAVIGNARFSRRLTLAPTGAPEGDAGGRGIRPSYSEL